MEVTFMFQGMLKSFFNWKSKTVIEVPENCVWEEALQQIYEASDMPKKSLGFAVIGGKRVPDDYPLKPGDVVKVFPKSFGG